MGAKNSKHYFPIPREGQVLATKPAKTPHIIDLIAAIPNNMHGNRNKAAYFIHNFATFCNVYPLMSIMIIEFTLQLTGAIQIAMIRMDFLSHYFNEI